MNLIKVEALHSYYLFNVCKKYTQALELLESLNASPLDVLELYPDLIEPGDTSSLMHSTIG